MLDATSPPDRLDGLSAYGSPAGRAKDPTDRDLQRALGSGRILVGGSERGTRILDLFHRYPIRIMLPKNGGGAIGEAVLVNAAGGVAGGDRLESDVTALADASIAVTSQAAEKIYRALSEPACVVTKLTARGGAKLAWLPQE